MVSIYKERWNFFVIISAIIAIIYLLAGFNYELNIYDEAIGIYGAQRIINGDIPYSDFWTIYAPGYFYMLSSVIYFIGNNILTERLFSIIIMFICLSLIYLIAEKLTNKKFALIPFFLSLVWFGYSPYYGKAVPLALLFGLINVVLILKLNNNNALKILFYSGIFIALTTLVRHDFGFYFFFASSTVVLIKGYSIIESGAYSRKILSGIKYLIVYLLGTIIVLLPFALYFINRVGFDELYNLLIFTPSKIFPEYRSLPFPLPLSIPIYYGEVSTIRGIQIRIETLIFYFPLIIYLCSFIKVTMDIKRKDFNFKMTKDFIHIFLLTLGITLMNQCTIRSDKEHLIPSLLISFILFGLYFYEIKANKKLKFLFIFISFFLMIVPVSDKLNRTKKALLSSNTYCFNIPKAKGICDEKPWAVEFEQTVNYLRKHVPEDEKILVANSFHDRVLMNDFMIYYLSERASATRYHEFHPGITTRYDVQKEIIIELQANQVNYIVQCPNTDFYEPNKSSISSGITLLDNYIKSYFTTIEMFGGYKILYRKSNLLTAK